MKTKANGGGTLSLRNQPRRHVEESQQQQRKSPMSFTPTGHEIPLATALKKSWLMTFMFPNNQSIVGKVSQFDKWTITVYVAEPAGMPGDDVILSSHPMTFFKHAIAGFRRTTKEDLGVGFSGEFRDGDDNYVRVEYLGKTND